MPEPTEYATLDDPASLGGSCSSPLPVRDPGSVRVATPTRGTADESAPRRPPADRYARADLNLAPTAAARARRLTRTTLARWDLGHLADDAETIASELTANALDAATTPRDTLPAIIFAIHHRPPELRIIVWDNGPGQPRPAPPGPDAEAGRGLGIVDALSQRWGWWPTPHSAGKVVWAALPVPADATPDDGPQGSSSPPDGSARQAGRQSNA